METTLIKSAAIDPQELRKKVSALWSKETSQDPEAWSQENLSLGQCAVTACLIHDVYGIPVVRGQAFLPDGTIDSHYWNEGDLDMTVDQFPAGTVIKTREGPQGQEARDYALLNRNTRDRFNLLMAKWQARYV